MSTANQFHYTNDDGYKSISAQPVWIFKISKPPGDHPDGAYFTTLPPGTPKLALRLRIPRTKLEFAFCFLDHGDLVPIPGGRGKFIFCSPSDYLVDEQREVAASATHDVEQKLR